jgi:hypothetical protein
MKESRFREILEAMGVDPEAAGSEKIYRANADNFGTLIDKIREVIGHVEMGDQFCFLLDITKDDTQRGCNIILGAATNEKVAAFCEGLLSTLDEENLLRVAFVIRELMFNMGMLGEGGPSGEEKVH